MNRVVSILHIIILVMLHHDGYCSIDDRVEGVLAEHSITPSPLCSDELFARRVYLAAAGRLPSYEEAEEFIDSKSKKRRIELVDKIIMSDDFVDMLSLKWGDLLKVKSEFPSNIWPNGAQAYNRWIRVNMRDNTPYNQFVNDLLLGTGSNFRTPQVSFYRAFVQRTPKNIVENIELLFLGTRTPQPQAELFFEQLRFKNTSEWKEEIVYVDTDVMPREMGVTMTDGREITLKRNSDLRQTYVDWLTSADNRQFARVMANRVWSWIMGRGIVDEPDDFRADNLPSNSKLLDYLTDSFIKSGYDVRALYREILLSDTFRRSSIPTEQNSKCGDELFAYYPTSRLTAEQLIDGISLITQINDRYVSRVPEPYSYYPSDLLSSDIGDASVSSPQLDLFGRPSRDNSLENQRNNSVNSKQTLYLLNSNSISSKIKSSRRIKAILAECTSTQEVIERVYIMMLTRRPSPHEISTLTTALSTNNSLQVQGEQLIWALINSPEFIFNH